MVAKVRVKVGQIEIDYEGDAAFLPDGLLGMIAKISELLKDHAGGEQHHAEKARTHSKGGKTMSTSTISSKLSVDSGTELAAAASAHLSLSKGQESFTRAEILNEMKTAKSFYKSSYNNNLSNSLDALIRAGRLNSVGKEVYSLPDKERQSIEAKLAAGS